MTLREELPPKDQPITFCSVDSSAHEILANEVDEFLRNGGKIEIVPPGICKDTIEFNKTVENKKQAEIREDFQKTPKPKQNAISVTIKKHISEAENSAKRKARQKPTMRPENRAKSGLMNIHQKDNDKWVVTVKSMHVGTYKTKDQAIAARDVERERLRLPKAEY